MTITVTYAAIDGARKEESFANVEAARAFAINWVGAHPDIAAHYAVSADGIGKVMVSGCSLGVLFGLDAPRSALPFYVEEVSINEDRGTSSWSKVTGSESASIEAALAFADDLMARGGDGVRLRSTTEAAAAELNAWKAAKDAANLAGYEGCF